MTKQQYQELKAELKQLAQIIKIQKHNHRASQSQSMGGKIKFIDEPDFVKNSKLSLWYAIYEYRHKHIVISLLRGKTREQIEKPKPGNEPNETYIKKLMDYYVTVEQTVCVSA
jgi:hypothetical protein